MNGLYFYKLVSPYKEDVTKDCKLTVNEIDHNFVTLKDADIKEISFNKETKVLTLIRNNKEELSVNLGSDKFDVEYDSEKGIITITHGDDIYEIEGLITTDNLGEQCVIKEINTDDSLIGLGNNNIPLGIVSVEKTGKFRPAIKCVDLIKHETLPLLHDLKVGDRYVTHEFVSDYGFLYNFHSVQKIAEDLRNGWRIPTKEDWDNMLNAIEPCDVDKNHDEKIANHVLGKFAGKFLKSADSWEIEFDCDCDDETELEGQGIDVYAKHPKHKPVNPQGKDLFGMKIIPAGFKDGCEVADYFGKRAYYWSNTVINETDVYVKRFDFNKAGVVQTVESPHSLFSLRLVKDYNGSNFHEVEFINGLNYKTVLLPSENTEKNHTIWTAENIAFIDPKYHPEVPHGMESGATRMAYVINDWNGFKWVRKEIHEGETIVLFHGLNGDEYQEYQLVHGELVCTTDAVYEKIIDEVVKEFGETIGSGFTDASGNVISITEVITKEIEERKEADEKLQENIDSEAFERSESDKQLQENINKETDAREANDLLLQENIEEVASIVSGSTEAIDDLKSNLANEIIERQNADENLQDQVNEVTSSLTNEISERKQVDEELTETISNLSMSLSSETEERVSADELLNDAINEVASGLSETNDKVDALSGETKEVFDKLVKEGSFECENGVLTLKTNDGSEIIINLNSNYGTFPSTI